MGPLMHRHTYEVKHTHTETHATGAGAHPHTHTPLLVVGSLDEVEEDVEELVSLPGLGVEAGRAQDEGDELLDHPTEGENHTHTHKDY